MMSGTGLAARQHHPRKTTLPFGTYEKRRNMKKHLLLLVLFGLFCGGIGIYIADAKRKSGSSPNPHVNTDCGDRGNPFGHIVGYLDGIAAYSNCNDNVVSNAFAMFRPNGEMCSSMNEDGAVTFTPIGERLKTRWELFEKRKSANKNGDGGDPSEAEDTKKKEPLLQAPPSTTASDESSSPSSSYVCGVQTGMMWQCVEFARRYWYLTQRTVFGSVEGAEDIFRLQVADVLSEDVDGGANILHRRHLDTYPNHESKTLPAKGDALIWRRQTDMPYGHVGILSGIHFLPGSGFEHLNSHHNGGGLLGDGNEAPPPPSLHRSKEDPLSDGGGLDGGYHGAGATISPLPLVGGASTSSSSRRNAEDDGGGRGAAFAVDDSYEARRAAAVKAKLAEDVVEGFVKGAHLVFTEKVKAAMGDASGKESRIRLERMPKPVDERSVREDARRFLKGHIPIGTVGLADQNYHSKAWRHGRGFARYLVLLKDDTHAEGQRYVIVDPEGYAVLGWIRLGEVIAPSSSV